MDDEERGLDSQEEEGKPSKKHPKIKKALITTIAVLTGLSVTAVTGAVIGYNAAFGRYDRPDYGLTAGVRCIDRSFLTREEITFPSGGARLQGYYYPHATAKGLVVLCHGIHAGADDYLPIAEYMHENGYAVFSFDYRGTYDSEGSGTIGMCQSLVDLDNALNFIGGYAPFQGLPVCLVGHSWGGYAAASVLSLHPGVRAVATISAPASGYTLILEKGEQYAGKLASKGLPELFLNTYQKILFGSYVNYNAVRGINDTEIPVLVAHGKEDETIDFSLQSIPSHEDELRKEGVSYFLSEGTQGGHNSILYSEDANAYASEIDAAYRKKKKDGASDEELRAFIASVDHRRYSAVNEELFRRIVALFDGEA